MRKIELFNIRNEFGNHLPLSILATISSKPIGVFSYPSAGHAVG